MKNSIKKTDGVYIIACSSIVGKKEYDGPLGGLFDMHDPSDRFGADTWELAESEMSRRALNLALKKATLRPDDIDFLLAGDLQNQCVGTANGLLDFDIAYLGLFGACSTLAEGMLIGSLIVSGGKAERAVAVASSHNCAAERQFRSPVEYGGQRTPTAQWTVTGAGAYIISKLNTNNSGFPQIRDVLAGIVFDSGVTDQSNMGAAMAPAAADTLYRYFTESGSSPADFDLILTGDLGFEGSEILVELLGRRGYDISANHNDCGKLIYDREAQDVHCGGSGCGCCAVVFGAYIFPKMREQVLKNILFIATGAMMSPSSVTQGCSIPSVAHLLHITA